MGTFGLDKGASETSCIQVIISSLCEQTCTGEQFTYRGKSRWGILALNYEIDYFDLLSRDFKGQEIIKQPGSRIDKRNYFLFLLLSNGIFKFLLKKRNTKKCHNLRLLMTVEVKEQYFWQLHHEAVGPACANNIIKITDYSLLLIAIII